MADIQREERAQECARALLSSAQFPINNLLDTNLTEIRSYKNKFSYKILNSTKSPICTASACGYE